MDLRVLRCSPAHPSVWLLALSLVAITELEAPQRGVVLERAGEGARGMLPGAGCKTRGRR